MTNASPPSVRRINPPELGTPPGYSQIVDVSAGRIIFIAGQTALDRDGNVVGKADFAAQAGQVFQNLTIALQAGGCTAANLIKLTVFLTDTDNLGRYREARNRFFASVTPSARGDAGRGFEALWAGFFDRDRGDRGGMKVTRPRFS
jgi:enamine deaminase RidA (YjgF/YER057c/UK114 family)